MEGGENACDAQTSIPIGKGEVKSVISGVLLVYCYCSLPIRYVRFELQPQPMEPREPCAREEQ